MGRSRAAVMAESSRETKQPSSTPRSVAFHAKAVAASPTFVSAAPAVKASDHAAEDRVRAWYQARAAAEFAATAPVATASTAAAARLPAIAAPMPVAKEPSAVESSTEDDAAAIHEESRIPSTAPTERIPAPFTHGDLQGGKPAPAADSTRPHGLSPAPMAGTLPPALHGPAPAAKSVAAAAAKPKLDPQLADTMAREALDDSDAVGFSSRSPTALVGSTANTKLAERPALAVLNEAPALQGDPFASDRLIAPMRGSHMILVHQNQMAVSDGLLRVANDGQMEDMQRHKLLVALPNTASIQPDGRLPLNRRYARPWTVQFLNDLAQAHYARFHTPLVITSAVRTVAFQRHLVRVNGNAAPPTGDVASPHLYGQAVDLAKHGMTLTEIAWLRAWLTPVENDGKIDVEEEFLQSCFHISVYRRYAPQPVQREVPAVEEAPSRRLQQARAVPLKRRHISTALLAAGLR